jgi:hypothetical protein
MPNTGNPFVIPPQGFATTYYGLNTPAKMQLLESRVGAANICLIYGGGPTNDTDARKQITDSQFLYYGAPYWVNGRPVAADRQEAGDTLIPAFSAAPTSIWSVPIPPQNRYNVEMQGDLDHGQLAAYDASISAMSKCLAHSHPPFLSEEYRPGGAPQAMARPAFHAMSLSEPQPTDERALLLYSTGSTALLLTDAQGRRLGIDPASGTTHREIPDSIASYDAAVGRAYIMVMNPDAGDYHVQISGSRAYQFYGWYADSTTLAGVRYASGRLSATQADQLDFNLPATPAGLPIPPDVQAGRDATVTVGQPLTLHGVFRDSNPSDTHTISWNFGDGTTSIGVLSPTHTYTTPGVYTATLTLADSSGLSGQDTV